MKKTGESLVSLLVRVAIYFFLPEASSYLILSAFVFSLLSTLITMSALMDLVLGATTVLFKVDTLFFSCFLIISSFTKALLLSIILFILSICFFFS